MSEVEYIQCVAITERSTANTVRFEELVPPGGQAIITKIYVQKKALARIGNPQMIEITIKKK